MKTKKMLIIGGAGYIGSHMTYMALDEGWEVTVIDNLSRGYLKAIPNIVKFIQCDITDKEKIETIIMEVEYDVVLHFAAFAYVGESYEKPDIYYENNVIGSKYLIDALLKKENGKRKVKFVFSSTCAVYGEVNDKIIDESMSRNPINPYGSTKKIIEDLLSDYVKSGKGLSYIALRYFNAAGCDFENRTGEYHEPETHLIPLAIDAALNDKKLNVYGDNFDTDDGTCVRDYIHVNDLCSAHLLAAEALLNGSKSEIYNLGNNKGFSVFEIIEKIKKLTKKNVTYDIKERRKGDPAKLIANSDKIRRELGWKPKYEDINIILDSAIKGRKINE
jgi:UDP-glucose 4-epimerase